MSSGWPLAPATTSTRHNGAPTMTTDKEKGTTPFESAPQTNDTADSTSRETPRADLLAWVATLAAFALAGWLAEVAR